MNDNPFQSPRSSSPRYYTDDITSMPWRLLWRVVRRQGVIGYLLLLPMFGLRKLRGVRYPANAGLPRADRIRPMDRDEFDALVDDSFREREEQLRQLGMEELCCTQSRYIGNTVYLVSLWLDPSGELCCEISHIDIRLGEQREIQNIISFQSWLKSGEIIETGIGNPDDFVPEMIPPGHVPELHDRSTSASVLWERQRQRIVEGGGAIQLSRDEALERILQNSQDLFDFMVERGFYTPLTPEEVDRLQVEGEEFARIRRIPAPANS